MPSWASAAWAGASLPLRIRRTSLAARGLALLRGAPLTGRPQRSRQLRGVRHPCQPGTPVQTLRDRHSRRVN